MRTLLVVLAVMLVTMIEIGCRYAQHESCDVRLYIDERITSIRYCEYGVPGEIEDYFTVDIPNKSFYYETGYYLWEKTDPYHEIEAKINHVCNDSEWRFIASNLNAMTPSKWEERYDNDDVLDGTAWEMEFCSGTNVVRKYSGANAWPELSGHLWDILHFVKKHPKTIESRERYRREKDERDALLEAKRNCKRNEYVIDESDIQNNLECLCCLIMADGYPPQSWKNDDEVVNVEGPKAILKHNGLTKEQLRPGMKLILPYVPSIPY